MQDRITWPSHATTYPTVQKCICSESDGIISASLTDADKLRPLISVLATDLVIEAFYKQVASLIYQLTPENRQDEQKPVIE